ncbi:S8 family serine peptidase [Dapis sp. BLCC M172]|uniref:S8 family serine peptidase n=1 Tax=Dapis sp. BLCC M172 TaxID=2975281 RepID=UPI003CF77CE5
MKRTMSWLFALMFAVVLLLSVQPSQAIAASSCSLCYDCGGKWPTFSGVIPTREDAMPYERGSACSGDLTPTSDTSPYLCCQEQGETPPPSEATPNDSMYDQQWGYENIGMPAVWGTTSTQTVTGVTVAVIDDGVYAGGHPDLPPRSTNNARFLNSGADIGTGVDAADSPPSQAVHHGTHVSGTILATTNNTTGVAGTPWNQSSNNGVNHISVRVLGSTGSGTFSDIIDGIYYAAGITNSHGLSSSEPADIINMSLGGGGNCSPTLENAISQAVAAGSAVIVAGGNAGNNNPQQPASCPSVTLTVGATDINNQLASFSSYGFNDLSAPGVNILSTYRNPDYDSLNGTSMATPHVSGAATVLLQKNPSLSPAQIKALLVNNAESFGDSRMGTGILRVPDAFESAAASEKISGEILAMDNNDLVASRGEISVNAEFVPGEILVQYKEPQSAVAETQKLLGKKATVVETSRNPNIPILIRLSEPEVAAMSEVELKQATLDAIAELLESPDVVYAEPNYIFRAFSENK